MSRPVTPSHEFGSVPAPNASQFGRGYGGAGEYSTGTADFAPTGHVPDSSPLAQSYQHGGMAKFNEEFDASQRGSSLIDGNGLHRSASTASTTLHSTGTPSRSGTLKKRGSVKRNASLKRSGSRKSLRAGSIKGVPSGDGAGEDTHNSVFHTPIPTSGTPTDILANRFQAWRKLLKDLITYFREVQTSYEQRAKSLLKVSNVVNNIDNPSFLLTEGGLNDANRILRDFHKQSITEANKAKEIEIEVIGQLSGLRADLGSKIKEIKSLSGDFKNSVEKEKDASRKAVSALEEALSLVDENPDAVAGKGDPYVIRLSVDRQIERQIDEENYLHRAYLNLEGSGRELESIVVGEIQKAYNALASILKRDADEAYNVVERLRNGPIAMDKAFEWVHFVEKDPHFVNPRLPLRRLEDIEYPGKNHPAAAEVRAGMLERKSKYLKSYTPGWYVLSPTHLHEFKSADRIYTQPPVMSLYLPDQKLGPHSQPGSSSHKFMLKGRQTGSMHRGHSWVFRAETYDTMLAWFDDIKALTEKSGAERNEYVRCHARSVSGGSARSIASGSELEEDEADEVPYSAQASMASQQMHAPQPQSKRPSPGGRFPSDLQVNRHLQAPLSPSSGSSDIEQDLTAAAGGLQASGHAYPQEQQHSEGGRPEIVHETPAAAVPPHNAQSFTFPPPEPAPAVAREAASGLQPMQAPPNAQPVPIARSMDLSQPPDAPRVNSLYGDWMAPAAGGAAAGVLGSEVIRHHNHQNEQIPDALETHPIKPTAPTHTVQPIVPIPVPSASASSGPLVDSVLTSPTSLLSDSTGPVATADAVGDVSTPTTSPTTHPGMTRHGTDFSVSDLHVPGEYPKRTSVVP
ncbi:hypothetical protein EJ05DRAFT_379637 [Pseudovirgaria hyperparasitica]|uniref:PH domain-containing protein n=1 Tax=Pseudovirgaria hyperparasitica TaxID=470096 RepID=A0A6A6W9A1_9PEZI|nr:uncharacterized protein EJ05DRAFT_379637 [Pseudovirgaria hyperparasitica]KAF2758167.1 hypothetical protein EJ05DRAFT_379637 [Pseudovirgaria hyperparasitica]